MPHEAIIGLTGSGKTFAARAKARKYRERGVATLVLHKPRERWAPNEASWQTCDPAEFLRMFWASKSCACFMELSDADVDFWDKRFHKCFTEGRHEGHRCHFLSQRGPQVHPNIRDNCHSLLLFSSTAEAANAWAKSFNDPTLNAASGFMPKEFFYKPSRWQPAQHFAQITP